MVTGCQRFVGRAAVLLALVGCSPEAADVSPTPDSAAAPTTSTVPAACRAAPGSETDLTLEPPYTANYLYRWRNRQGCEVRLDVLMLRQTGPDYHCAPWPPEILMGPSLGAPFNSGAVRLYVRDPDGTWGDPARPDGFSPNADLPPGAIDTGYRRDDTALWVVPGDESFIYLVRKDRTERWPRGSGRTC